MPINPTPGVVTSPAGELRTSYNFISPYDYAMQYEPNKVLSLHPRYGNGLITGFCKIVGAEKSYNSDEVLHGEQRRLMNFIKDVTVAGDVFTTAAGESHQVRVNDSLMISDGTTEAQAIVTAVNSATEFVAANKAVGAFAFAGAVNISVFSSEWAKGTPGFTEGHAYDADIYKNYTHILKEYYDVAESDMAHATWITTPQGENKWYAYEMERTRCKFMNKQELTHVFNVRSEVGSDAEAAGSTGMNGIVPTVMARGNVGNDYIQTLTEMDDYTKRIRRQGDCTAYTVWCDQDQRIAMSNMLGAVNKYADTGANYGVFNNSKDLAVHLDFESFTRNGITFHLTDWRVLNDPTVMGGERFLDTNVAAMFVPAGEREISDETGSKSASPYLCVRYRKQDQVDRQMRTKIFGLPGTEIREDKMEIQYISEQTNQVVGANEWIVVKRA